MVASLVIHLCAGVIALAIALNGQGSGDSLDTGPSDGGADFEMSLPAQAQPASAHPASLRPPVLRPFLAYPELESTIVLPPIQPLQLISNTPPAPPVAEATGDSTPSPAAGSPGKSVSKSKGKPGSGNGHGPAVKRPKPSAPPKLLQAPPPRYPTKAKANKITGKAAVLIQVRPNGSASATSLYRSSGNAELDQAAVAAARSWKFSATPSLADGETIPVIVHVTFSL